MEDRLWSKRRRLTRALTVDDAIEGVANYVHLSAVTIRVWLRVFSRTMRAWLNKNLVQCERDDDGFTSLYYELPPDTEPAEVVCLFLVVKAWLCSGRGDVSSLVAMCALMVVWSHLYLETSAPGTKQAAQMFSVSERQFSSVFMALALHCSDELMRALTTHYASAEAELAYFASLSSEHHQ